MNKQLLLGEAITLIDADLGTYEVALYEEDEKGDVYRDQQPVGFYEITKEYYLNTFTYKHTGEKRLKDASELQSLVVVGIRHADDTYEEKYPFRVCVKVKPSQVEWGK